MIEIDYKRWRIFKAKKLHFADYLPLPSGYHFISCLNSYIDFPYEPPYEKKQNTTAIINLLDDSKELFNKVHKKRRNIIRRSLNMGFQCIYQKPSPNNLEEFRYLHNKFLAHKIHKIYFIDAFLSYLPHLSVFSGKYDDRTLCMMLILHDNKTAILYRATRDESFQGNQGYYINSFLLWEVLMHFKNLGFQTFDLGGVSLNRDSAAYPITQFKMSFGGEVIPFYNYEAVITPLCRNLLNCINWAKRFHMRFLTKK
jgi:lipid II:glycine glycyltransferase (peptidoglycan interpeptide bridge formation enzyme)